jgi:DNA end-binding protein Ku
LIEAKVNKMPVPKEEVAEPRGKVVNLMDALRKSLGGADNGAGKRVPKKPVASVKADSKKGIGLVKPSSRTPVKRKSA